MAKDNGLAKFFANAFREVVLPHLEDLANRLKGVENRLGKVENRLGKVEDRLFKVEDRLDRHGTLFDYHEKRISKLETHSIS